MKNKNIERAKYGAAAAQGLTGLLPTAFPRIMGPNSMKYLQEVVDSGLTIDMIGRFEKKFAEEMGVRNCVAAPGCSPAILLLAEALNFDPGDEIIFSPITDYGTIMGFIKNACIPVFADVEPNSVNMSARTIEPCITKRTKAIVVVHMTGIICDMDPILELAKKHGILVIEDACQAVYGRYKGRLAGTMGDAGAFSFDAEKTMGSDIGGCFITNNDELAEYARFRCQSRGAHMKPGFGRQHIVDGNAIRMPNCTAALNLAQLEIIQDNVATRDRTIRSIYKKLKEIPGIYPEEIPDYLDVYSCWMSSFSIDPKMFSINADKFGEECAALGIPGISTARYYLMPEACTFLEENAKNKVYPYTDGVASFEYSYKDVCPNARAYLENWLRWSTFCEKYTEEDCELVAQIVKSVADKYRV
jgi:perosamine synthetase